MSHAIWYSRRPQSESYQIQSSEEEPPLKKTHKSPPVQSDDHDAVAQRPTVYEFISEGDESRLIDEKMEPSIQLGQEILEEDVPEYAAKRLSQALTRRKGRSEPTKWKHYTHKELEQWMQLNGMKPLTFKEATVAVVKAYLLKEEEIKQSREAPTSETHSTIILANAVLGQTMHLDVRGDNTLITTIFYQGREEQNVEKVGNARRRAMMRRDELLDSGWHLPEKICEEKDFKIMLQTFRVKDQHNEFIAAAGRLLDHRLLAEPFGPIIDALIFLHCDPEVSLSDLCEGERAVLGGCKQLHRPDLNSNLSILDSEAE